MHQVKVRAHAGARAALGWSECEMTIPEGSTKDDLIALLLDDQPIMAPLLARTTVWVNRAWEANWDDELPLGAQCDLVPAAPGMI